MATVIVLVVALVAVMVGSSSTLNRPLRYYLFVRSF